MFRTIHVLDGDSGWNRIGIGVVIWGRTEDRVGEERRDHRIRIDLHVDVHDPAFDAALRTVWGEGR